jgi:hypothetical protein
MSRTTSPEEWAAEMDALDREIAKGHRMSMRFWALSWRQERERAPSLAITFLRQSIGWRDAARETLERRTKQ